MLSSFVIALREGIEAALIVAALLSLLTRYNLKHLAKYVYVGAFGGLFVSILSGAIIYNQIHEFEAASRQLFEGGMMLFVAGMIAYFVLWMRYKTPSAFTEDIKNANITAFPLFIIAFLSVFREGLEVILFALTSVSQEPVMVLLGVSGGLCLAVFITAIIYRTAIKLNLDMIFKIITLVLIFLGSEMFAEGMLVFFPDSDGLEMVAMLIYLIPCLYLFLKDSLKKYIKSKLG